MSSGVNPHWAEVAAYLRAQRQLARLSLRSLARLTNVSDSYLSQVERGLHQPSPDVLKALARALGVPTAELYQRMGWLDRTDEPEQAHRDGGEGDGDGDGVEGAIDRDRRLTPSQKHALRSMYRALVGDE